MRQKKVIAVVASSQAEVPKRNLEMASYSCNSCGNSFAVNASIDPFCVHCGSTEVDELDETLLEDETMLPEDEESLSTVVCPECGQHNIMSDDSAVALAGLMSCVTCGSEISYEYSEISSEPEEEEMPLGDDEDIEEDIEEEGLDDVEESMPKKGSPNYRKGQGNAGEKGRPSFRGRKSNAGEKGKSMSSDESLDDLDEDLDLDDGLEDTEEAGEKKGKVTCGLADVVIANTNASVTFERLNPSTILAFVGDICVARLNNSDDYEHRDVFGHPSFMRSLANSAEANGTTVTLKDFDFSIPEVQVTEETVQAMSQLESTLAKVEAKALATANESIRQCISIAAVGLNKGFWKDKPHVLKAHLYEEMRAAGVRNPSSLIDRVFAKYSDDHHRTLFEIAFDLAEKTPDTRNSLAEAVGTVNYLKAEAEDTTESDDTRLEDSLIEASTKTRVLDIIPKGRLFAVNG